MRNTALAHSSEMKHNTMNLKKWKIKTVYKTDFASQITFKLEDSSSSFRLLPYLLKEF